jgi:raffinose/stachyose/melibiose transport system permease protein
MVWKSFGFHLVLFIAGLQQIDRTLYEAAEIDGASAWQRTRQITIPLLGPTIALSGFFIVINSLQAFDMIMGMTSGGPARATSTMVHYLYSDALAGFRVGFGSAIGVVIFAITLAFALGYRRLTRRLDVVHG